MKISDFLLLFSWLLALVFATTAANMFIPDGWLYGFYRHNANWFISGTLWGLLLATWMIRDAE